MEHERKNAGTRYLELSRRLALEGEKLSDEEGDAIYSEMLGILMALTPDYRKDLVYVAEHDQRRLLRKKFGPRADQLDMEPTLSPFRFLCRIPRAEAANLSTKKLGPDWWTYLKSIGIWTSFTNLIVVNDPDDTHGYLVYQVDSGRLF
jgi:hypothetical protein